MTVTTSNIQKQLNSISSASNLTTINSNITALQNKTVDISYINGTNSTYHANNLVVMGTINGLVYNKFQYLTNIFADVQGQLNPLINKTKDTFYNGTTLITYHANNLVVDGTINNLPKSKFAFLTTLASNVQTQIDSITTGISNGSLLPNFSIGTVTDLSSGTTPTVTRTGTNSLPVLNFGLTRGATGITGATPNISIGTTTTIAFNDNTASSVVLDPTSTALNPKLNFAIKQGPQGPKGDSIKGDKGDDGDTTAATAAAAAAAVEAGIASGAAGAAAASSSASAAAAASAAASAAANTAEITSIQTEVTNLGAEFTALTNTVTAINTRLTTAETNIATNTTNIATNTTNIATNTANITANTTSITTIQGSVLDIEAEIITMQGQLTVLENTMTFNSGFFSQAGL